MRITKFMASGIAEDALKSQYSKLANLKSEIDHVVSTKSKYLTIQFNCTHFTDNVERYKIFMANKVKSRNDDVMMVDFEGDICKLTINTNLFNPYRILSFLQETDHRMALADAFEEADRHNDGKLQWSLIDFKSLEEMVKVLGFGAEKYSPDNWKRGLPTSKIFESLMRHLTALQAGEEIDPESKLHHTGHVLCNAMFLAYMYQSKREFIR